MRTYWINKAKYFAVLLLQIVISAQAFAGDYPINIESRHDGQDILIIVHNNGNATISAKVNILNADNVASDHDWPINTVLPANSSNTLAKVFAADKTKGVSFNTQMVSMIGDFKAKHDPNAVYRLPYADGLSFTIGQAIGGPRTSHNTPDSLFAIDFTMPEGTPIVAARDGIVIGTENSFSVGGNDKYFLDKANFVKIIHNDGTIATYAHLMKDGVFVSSGQHVKTGTLLGYSGSTGFSSGPHLHFVVTHLVKNEESFSDVSIPISFYVGQPAVIFDPQKDLFIKAEYNGPATNPSEPKTNIIIDGNNQPPKISNLRPQANSVLPNYSAIISDSNTLLYMAITLLTLLVLNALKTNRDKKRQRKKLESIRKRVER